MPHSFNFMTEEVRQYYIFLGQVGLGGVDVVLFLLDHDMQRHFARIFEF